MTNFCWPMNHSFEIQTRESERKKKNRECCSQHCSSPGFVADIVERIVK